MSRQRSASRHSSDCCRGPEEETGCQEPRYDPKELRDAAKVLGPFLRLIGDANNPYARIVSREMCKTFYHLFHPGMHPVDVMKTIDWNAKTQRNEQLWTEFWQYVPKAKVRQWVSLKNDNLIDLDVNTDQCRPEAPRPPQNRCPGGTKPARPVACKRKPSRTPRCPKPQSPECPDVQEPRTSDAYPNLCDISPPEDYCEHQSAGSDPPQCCAEDGRPRPDAAEDRDADELDSKQIYNRIMDSKRELELLVEAASQKCYPGDADDIENADGRAESPAPRPDDRQCAGMDQYQLPYCEPGCSTYPTENHAAQYDYYRITANMPSPPQPDWWAQQDTTRLSPPTPAVRTCALDDTANYSDDERCDGDESFESVVNARNNRSCDDEDRRQTACDDEDRRQTACDDDQDRQPAACDGEDGNGDPISCNASMVANAFTTLSLAEQDLQRKKDAFETLTRHYLEFARNPIEVDPPSMDCPSAKQILKTIYENPPRILKPFDDCEWNDNAFRDRDFVRLLPFFENAHNQLEYVSKKQREYGINMLDDVMSTLYHIHYDLGDPRLKNDMLVEHVKLITANTWEAYFYPDGGKMPEVPEQPQPCYPPSPQRDDRYDEPPSFALSPRHPSPQPDVPRSKMSSIGSVSTRRSSVGSATTRRSSVGSATTRQSSVGSQSLRPTSPMTSPSGPPSSPKIAPKSPKHMRPSGHGRTGPGDRSPQQPPLTARPSKAAASKRRPSASTASRRPAANVSRQATNPPPAGTQPKCNFLRRSKPSGTPKPWAPSKPKQNDRPEDVKQFKAKPLPKFIRQRLASRDQEC